ncbi:MAG: excinuclease ABC subunit C, partial [Candidatus Omnitrophota bacterium]
EELGRVLGMAKAPETIEAFDVSNIMGEAAVGSMISFYKGRPKKSEYRHFRIKTVSGIDDYAMMREIVGRRYYRIVKEGKDLPDLILIDGGKGHLGAACGELENLGISKIPVVGIAKEFERLYIKGRKHPMVLPKESKALHLLQRIRNEAHRFAISYHKSLMSKRYR